MSYKQGRKRIQSIIQINPTIETLLSMASSLQECFGLFVVAYENLKKPEEDNSLSTKEHGVIVGMSILLPFVCELALTALYMLEHPERKDIPKEHSLLYWWENIKENTQKKIRRKFEELKKEEEIEGNLEEILKWNDKSHTEWRYWWRKGFATGSPSSINMQLLTKVIIEVGWSYPQDEISRKLKEGVEGDKEFDKARLERGMR